MTSIRIPVQPVRTPAAGPSLGAGNVVHHIRDLHPAPHAPVLREYGATGACPGSGHSLDALVVAARERAALLQRRGLRPGDTIGLRLRGIVDTFVHYVAVTGLGAAPLLVDPAARTDRTARQLDDVGAVGTIGPGTDVPVQAGVGDRFHLVPGEGVVGDRRTGEQPSGYPYEHDDQDIVLLCQASGPDGGSLVRMSAHRQLLLAQDRRLLGLPAGPDDRVLVALPAAHPALIGYLMATLALGLPAAVVGDLSSAALEAAVSDFRPTVVVSCPNGHARIAGWAVDDATADVHTWINVGGLLHGAHAERIVRHGHRPGPGHPGGSTDGSRLIDNVGACEVGVPVFQRVHTPDTEFADGRLGRPTAALDGVVVLDEDTGLPAADGSVGRLAVAGSGLPGGHRDPDGADGPRRRGRPWVTHYRVRRDEDGVYFHVGRDRTLAGAPDGLPDTWFVEDAVLRSCDTAAECAVVPAVTGPRAVGQSAVVVLNPGAVGSPARLCAVANRALADGGLEGLAAVHLARAENVPRDPDGVPRKSDLRSRLTEGEYTAFDSGFQMFRRPRTP